MTISKPILEPLFEEAWAMLRATVERNPWIPVKPTPHQAAFLALPCREALFGGAAGGGKSIALLAAALQFAEVPGYSALLLRRTYRDLALPGALMDLSHQWLRGTAAKWNDQDHQWVFPSGATLGFGYLETDADQYRYQGAELQFIGFDELTQLNEGPYRYLMSRLRRRVGVGIPLRMRAASNPGGRGHEWVRSRFLDSPASETGRVFIPSRMTDNPHLDQVDYRRSLEQLDPVTRAQLLHGDWAIRPSGGMFRREWFPVVDAAPADAARCRAWDSAATEGGGDATAGCRLARGRDGVWYVEHMVVGRWGPHGVDQVIRQTAAGDTPAVRVRFEQEPGSSGKMVVSDWVRKLAGYDVAGVPATGEKSLRWRPFAAQAEAGNVRLVRGGWNLGFLDEAAAAPHGAHDDQIDAAALAFNTLALGASGGVRKVVGF